MLLEILIKAKFFQDYFYSVKQTNIDFTNSMVKAIKLRRELISKRKIK